MKISELRRILANVEDAYSDIEVIVLDPLGHLNLIQEDGQQMTEGTDWTADYGVVTQSYPREGQPDEMVCMLIPHPDTVIFGDDLRANTQLFTNH